MIGQGRAAELLYTGRTMSADEGLAWGFFNRLVAPADVLRGGAGAGARARRRPDVRARDDQGAAASRMVDGPRRRDRRRGRGAGDLHADRGLPARLRSVRREAPAALRGQLSMSATRWTARTSTGRSSTTRHRTLAGALDAWLRARIRRPRTARRRRRLPRLGARARRGRLAAPLRAGALRRRVPRGSTRARCASCASARLSRRPRRLRVRDAGPRQRAARARRRATATTQLARAWLPRVARGEAIAAFALSEPRRGSDVAALALRATARRRRLRARRREDVDLQRRHRRLLRDVRAHRRRGCGRHLGVRGRRRDARACASPSASR